MRPINAPRVRETLRERRAPATKLDAATCLPKLRRRQVAANLKGLGYGG